MSLKYHISVTKFSSRASFFFLMALAFCYTEITPKLTHYAEVQNAWCYMGKVLWQVQYFVKLGISLHRRSLCRGSTVFSDATEQMYLFPRFCHSTIKIVTFRQLCCQVGIQTARGPSIVVAGGAVKGNKLAHACNVREHVANWTFGERNLVSYKWAVNWVVSSWLHFLTLSWLCRESTTVLLNNLHSLTTRSFDWWLHIRITNMWTAMSNVGAFSQCEVCESLLRLRTELVGCCQKELWNC